MNKFQLMLMAVSVALVGLINADSNINLTGTVTDQDKKPLSGVRVFLDNNTPSDTTGADGKYVLAGVGVAQMAQTRAYCRPVITGNAISFKVGGATADVRLEILDLSGKCVRTVMNSPAVARAYTVKLPVKNLTPSAYIIVLHIGSERFTQRVLLHETGLLASGNNSAAAPSEGNRTAAGAEPAIIDYIHFWKENFQQKDTAIYSYTGTYNITMNAPDTIPPVVTLIGKDTVYFAYQDSAHYKVFWDTDSFENYIRYEDNSGYARIRPGTNTLMEKEHSSITSIEYTVDDFSGNSTTKSRLIVLYDSTVKNDTKPPELTVVPDTMKFTKGDKFEFMKGVSVKDLVDSLIDFTKFIKVTDDIKSEIERDARFIQMDVVGTYTMTYQVMDTHRNLAIKKRTLIVTQ